MADKNDPWQNPFAPFGGVFGTGLTGMSNAVQSYVSQPWWQQQQNPQMRTHVPAPQQQRIDVPPGQRRQFEQQNPWTPAAVQAMMHGLAQDKMTQRIAPADQYKAGMWASVPGSTPGGAPAAPFSWNMPGGTNDPIGRIQHYLQMQQPSPVHVSSPLMPGLDPLGNVTNRVMPNMTTAQLSAANYRPDLGWNYGTPPPPQAVPSPWTGFGASANPQPGFSY